MPRAIAKTRTGLKPEAYLVSLAFKAVGPTPLAKLEGAQVWVYRPLSQ
jgi:hypothetical protein